MIASTKARKELTDIPDKTFPINIFTVCEPKSPTVPLHWHEHLEWMHIRRGSFRIQVGQLFENVSEGDAVFINSKHMHAAFPLGSNTELTAIVFNEALIRNSALDNTEVKYLMPLLFDEIRLSSVFKSDNPYTSAIADSLNRLVDEFERKQEGYELFIKSELLRCLGFVYRATEKGVSTMKNRPEAEGVIHPLIRHLSTRFNEPLTIREAARICSLSPNYFCSLFKKTTGKTLIEYINMLRIHEADRLLRETDYRVNEVAYLVGFTNMTYFGRVFKRLKNVSPSALRNQLDKAGRT